MLAGAVDGDLHLRVTPGDEESLRALASACNRMLDGLQQTAEEARRRLQAERDLATTLIEAFSGPAAVIGPAGDLVLANAGARAVLGGNDGNALARYLIDCVEAGLSSGSFTCGGRRYEVSVFAPPATGARAAAVVSFHGVAA